MLSFQPASTGSANVPSFVDLRAFAQDRNLGIPAIDSNDEDPFLASRRFLDLPHGRVAVGVITLEAGNGKVDDMPYDEFIIVCQGRAVLAQQGRTLTLRPGSSLVIKHGSKFSWSSEEPVSIIFMRYQSKEPGDGSLVPIRETPPLEPSGAPLAELLLTPTPDCRNYTDYRSSDGEFTCGTWDSTPYHRRAMVYRIYELMYLLEGSVTFEDETGRIKTFGRGDIFLVEQRAQCSWLSREHVVKVYAIHRPA